MVAKPRTVVTFDSSRVFASQKCQQSQGSGGVVVEKPRTVVTFGLVSCLRVSKVSTVTGIGGVVVAKRRTVVTFGLLSSLRVSKVSTVTGIRGVVVAKPRTVVTFGLVSCLRVSKVSTVRRIRGGRGREAQNCRHFWTPLVSSRLKSVNSHKDRGFVVAKPRTVVTFDSSRVCVAKVSTVTRIGGVVVAKPRTVVTFGLLSCLRVSKVSTVTGIRGGRGRETQNCRHFWTPLVSSRLKSVNSHRNPGGSWSRNPELSSLLDSSRLFASQKCQQSQGSGGVVVAKPRTVVVTFGLVSCLRISKVSTVTGIGGVVVAKPRTVVTFGLVSCLRVSKVSTVTRIRGGRGREAQNCRHFWTPLVSSRLKPRTVVTFGLVSCLRVSKVSTVTGIRGGRGREAQNCRHFWTPLVSSRLKVSKVTGIRGGRGREAQNCRHFWTHLAFSRLKIKCLQSQGSGGLGSRSPELSSLLGSSLGGFWLCLAELSSHLKSSSEQGTRGEKSDERRGERATLQPCPQNFECRPGGVVLVHDYSRDFLRILPGVLEELIYWPNCAMQSSRLEAWPSEGFCVTVVPWTLRWLCDWLQAAISASFRLGFS